MEDYKNKYISIEQLMSFIDKLDAEFYDLSPAFFALTKDIKAWVEGAVRKKYVVTIVEQKDKTV